MKNYLQIKRSWLLEIRKLSIFLYISETVRGINVLLALIDVSRKSSFVLYSYIPISFPNRQNSQNKKKIGHTYSVQLMWYHLVQKLLVVYKMHKVRCFITLSCKVILLSLRLVTFSHLVSGNLRGSFGWCDRRRTSPRLYPQSKFRR